MSNQTTTDTTFPTPAADRYDASRQMFADAKARGALIETNRLEGMTRQEVVELANLPKSTSKAAAIQALVEAAWHQSTAAAEKDAMRSEASREARAIEQIGRAKLQVQMALVEVRKATTATFPRPEWIMDAAERLAVTQTIQRHWAQVAYAITEHGLEPLAAVEEVAKEVVSEALSTARGGTHRSTSGTSNLTAEAEQKGRATWLNEAARFAPAVPNSRW
jgi:hypothetical protein